MSFDFSVDTPIYLQIIVYLKEQIVSGKLKAGQKIASVRELSAWLNVNPNTTQKALLELEESGLIVTERTNGKFVTKNLSVIEKAKKEMIKENLQKFFKSMNKIGLSYQECIDAITNGGVKYERFGS